VAVEQEPDTPYRALCTLFSSCFVPRQDPRDPGGIPHPEQMVANASMWHGRRRTTPAAPSLSKGEPG